MKTIYLTILAMLFFVLTSQAQGFEGKITFKMEFKGEMAAQMAAFAPSGMIYQIKDSDSRFQMLGGASAMMGTFIVLDKEKVMYVVKDADKKTYKIAIGEEENKQTQTTKITKEDGEEEEILGYKCQKYKVETTAQGQEIVQYIWAAKDIQIAKPHGAGNMAGGNLHVDGVEGFPLKTVANMNVMGMEMTTITVATEVDKSKLKKDLFESPKAYKVETITMEQLTTKMMGGKF